MVGGSLRYTPCIDCIPNAVNQDLTTRNHPGTCGGFDGGYNKKYCVKLDLAIFCVRAPRVSFVQHVHQSRNLHPTSAAPTILAQRDERLSINTMQSVSTNFS